MSPGGIFAARYPLEQQVRGHFANLVYRLPHHRQRRLKNVGNIEVVESRQRNLPRNVDLEYIAGV
jgi:hypothetical protein